MPASLQSVRRAGSSPVRTLLQIGYLVHAVFSLSRRRRYFRCVSVDRAERCFVVPSRQPSFVWILYRRLHHLPCFSRQAVGGMPVWFLKNREK